MADTDAISLGAFDLSTGDYASELVLIGEYRNGLIVQPIFVGLNAADGQFSIQGSNDVTNMVVMNNELGELPITIAANNSSHLISLAPYAVPQYIKFIFTRNSVTAGTIQVKYLRAVA